MTVPGYKLLIVDDEEFNREILQEMLAGAGYEVELAADGEEAWAMLDTRANRYSAVLLDRMMPNTCRGGVAQDCSVSIAQVSRSACANGKVCGT